MGGQVTFRGSIKHPGNTSGQVDFFHFTLPTCTCIVPALFEESWEQPSGNASKTKEIQESHHPWVQNFGCWIGKHGSGERLTADF